jgi:heme-degrading monooxygenase HmoA
MVVLINSFEVPQGREDEFLDAWHAIARHLADQPGYVGTRLHRAIGPGARFSFVNVGEWATPQAFQEATTSADFQRLAAGLRGFPASPGLYQVEYEHGQLGS